MTSAVRAVRIAGVCCRASPRKAVTQTCLRGLAHPDGNWQSSGRYRPRFGVESTSDRRRVDVQKMPDESIYALVPPAQEVPMRPRMYRSKCPGEVEHAHLVRPMGVPKRKESHATFGLPDGRSAKLPTSFTRAHTGATALPLPARPSKRKERRKGVTPLRSDRPVMNLKSGKDFVTINAVETILSKPPAKPEVVPYTMKPTYGKVPRYLKSNKLKVAAEAAQVEDYLRRQEEDAQANVTQLTAEERTQLMKHLKTKWSSVNTAYQKMTFTLDTPAKCKRKETYEAQLAEIEKDIELLGHGEVVLVVGN